jgi:PAT family beta-lactamase induction signal transducer AmpG
LLKYLYCFEIKKDPSLQPSSAVPKAVLYRDPRILGIFFLGFSSGLPFLLTLATLHVWLAEAGAPKTVIGFFVFITLPYTLKFLWAPFIDYFPFPFLSKIFGRRKGWLLGSQLCLILSLLLLGSTDPHHNILITAFAGSLVAFCSATQDIVFEAYRVEALSPLEVGLGAGASMLGYRSGMWVSGAGALYLASHFSWFVTYAFMAACVSIGIIAALLSVEPSLSQKKQQPLFSKKPGHFFSKIQNTFSHFLKQENWQLIVLYIFCYKIGDTILNVMTAPFLLEIGFSKIEIAHVAKSFGIASVILGGFVGSFTLVRKPLVDTLIICSLLQIFSCLMFALQAYAGHHLFMLFITIGVENLTCGMGTAAFIAYLSNLCRTPFTATHYALLSSIGSLARVSLSALAGWGADRIEWIEFYLFTAVSCIPCFLLLVLFAPHFEYRSSFSLSFREKRA